MDRDVIKIEIESDNSDEIARQLFNQIKDPDIVCEVISSMSTMLSDDDKKWCINKLNGYIPHSDRFIIKNGA